MDFPQALQNFVFTVGAGFALGDLAVAGLDMPPANFPHSGQQIALSGIDAPQTLHFFNFSGSGGIVGVSFRLSESTVPQSEQNFASSSTTFLQFGQIIITLLLCIVKIIIQD